MDGDASMTKKVANGVRRRLIKVRNSISNFIGIDDIFEDDYYQHIENNDSRAPFTSERRPSSRNDERSKPIKKKRSTASLRNTRDCPVTRSLALTPIHKHWNSVSSSTNRPHVDGNFKSSIRKITHMSVTSHSRYKQSATCDGDDVDVDVDVNDDDEEDDDDDDDEAELITREAPTVAPAPTVEVQIPDTVIGSLEYHTFTYPEATGRHKVESPELSTRPATKPSPSPEAIRTQRKRPGHNRKTHSISSSKKTSRSCDPSDEGLIINRSRPNSRCSVYGYLDGRSITKNSCDSDETLCNQRLLEEESGAAKTCESSEKNIAASQLDGGLAMRANSNGLVPEEEEEKKKKKKIDGPDMMTMTDKLATTQRNDDRILLPSQRDQALNDEMQSKLGPMTCRGALHSLSCEHLNTRFRSMEMAFTKINKDMPAVADKSDAIAKDQENLQAKSELQPEAPFNPETEKSQLSLSKGSKNCDKEIQHSCVHCKIALLRHKVNGENEENESKQSSAQQLPRYDDWEESPTEESYCYRQCNPNEFL